jgi:hypothetical protein
VEQLLILRQRIPVGLLHGKKLLEAAGGDIDVAIKMFQEEMTALVVDKTGITSTEAITYLTKHNFDIVLALKSIDETLYTLTELVLRRYPQNKEWALDIIIPLVKKSYNLKEDSWSDFHLPSAKLFGLVVIKDWLDYEGYEGFREALSFKLDIVTTQVANVFRFRELADALQEADAIRMAYFDHYDYVTAANYVLRNDAFKGCEQIYRTQRPLLIDAMYHLIQTNIQQFP